MKETTTPEPQESSSVRELQAHLEDLQREVGDHYWEMRLAEVQSELDRINRLKAELETEYHACQLEIAETKAAIEILKRTSP